MLDPFGHQFGAINYRNRLAKRVDHKTVCGQSLPRPTASTTEALSSSTCGLVRRRTADQGVLIHVLMLRQCLYLGVKCFARVPVLSERPVYLYMGSHTAYVPQHRRYVAQHIALMYLNISLLTPSASRPCVGHRLGLHFGAKVSPRDLKNLSNSMYCARRL